MAKLAPFNDPTDVAVIRPTQDPLDIDALTAALGEAPVDVQLPTTPVIFVDVRVHTAATFWLRSKVAVTDGTRNGYATGIATWIKYLRDERGHTDPDERYADVFAATEDDLHEFYADSQTRRRSRYYTGPDGWRIRNAAVAQFHKWAQHQFALPLPFTPVKTVAPHGQTHIGTGLRPRRRRGSAGTPVEPLWAEHLVNGALGVTADGEDLSTETSERNAAVLSLALGAGIRRGTINGITIYEIPPPRPGRALNKLNVPDFITKGDAGGMALVMERRMEIVRDYINGARHDHAALFDADTIDNPITILQATDRRWEGVDTDGVVHKELWAQTTLDVRRRIVTADGQPVVVALNTQDGSPLSYSTFGNIITKVRNFVIEHIEPDFPPGFRLHDCRHTFAVHMVCALVRKRFEGEFADDAVTEAMRTSLITDAINIVSPSLGHATSSTTRKFYLVTAGAWLFEDDIEPNHFIAEFN